MKWENFTRDRIERFTCKQGKKQSIYWDGKTPGLGLRVTAAGAKSFIFETALNGKTIRITIGDVKTWPIDGVAGEKKTARAEATRLKAMTDEGKDPRQVKAADEAAEIAKQEAKDAAAAELVAKELRESVTLGMVWPEYLKARKDAMTGDKHVWSDRHYADHVKAMQAGGEKRKRSPKLTTPGPLASLSTVRLIDLTPKKVTEWAKVEAKQRPTSARLALRLLLAFLSWSGKQDAYKEIIAEGAAHNKDARESLGKPKVKNDVLQREQLPAWFSAVKQIGNPVISAYLQTLLLVGARREELAALRWADVDFQWNSMTINDKVEDFRVIPLTPYVSHLLSSLPRRNQWVFSSTTSESGHITDASIAHRKACAIAALDMSLHGLRRSFATLAEWTEAPAGIAAQIQGHAPQGVRETNYIRRPLDLLRMWHVKIEAWMLEQAGIEFVPVKAGLRAVSAA